MSEIERFEIDPALDDGKNAAAQLKLAHEAQEPLNPPENKGAKEQ